MSLYKTMGDDVPDLYREIAASGEKPLVKRLQKNKRLQICSVWIVFLFTSIMPPNHFIWMIFEIVQAKLQYRKASQTDLLLTMAENKW